MIYAMYLIIKLRGGGVVGAEQAEAFDRGDEVIGAGERLGIAGEGVAGAVDEAGHAVEHAGERLLRGAEADEDCAVVFDGAVGHVATKDVAEDVLVGAGDVRGGGLVLELDAVTLGAAHDLLLLVDGESFPLGDVVLPLLQQEDGAGGARNAFGEQGVAGGVEQGGVLGAVDEAGEVAIVLVGPARGFFDEGGEAGEVADDGAGRVE